MRNSLLSRPPLAGPSSQINLNRSRSPTGYEDPSDATPRPRPQDAPPTIRFISATPSVVHPVAPFSSSLHSASTSSNATSSTTSAHTGLAPRASHEGEPSRRRLVPKKSKLGILGAKTKEKVNRDLSDVVRRLGVDPSSSSSTRQGGGFEIYVDHDEEEEGSIIVVQKKKSRMGLDGMRWGALGEVTNVPHVDGDAQEEEEEEGMTTPTRRGVVPKARKSMEILLKGRTSGTGGEENQKWWSIGRGRKEVKEKKSTDTIQPRSKTPDPFQPSEKRSRFNSLDVGLMLSGSGSGSGSNEPTPKPRRKSSISSVATLLGLPDRSKTPTVEPDLDGLPTNELNASTTGSIALRAIRSVRSLATMASRASMRRTSVSHSRNNSHSYSYSNDDDNHEEKGREKEKEGNYASGVTNSSTTVTTGKTKEKSEEKERRKKKRREEKEKGKEKEGSRREKKVKAKRRGVDGGEDEDDGALTERETKPKTKKKRSLHLKTSAGSLKAAGGSLSRQASMIMMPPAKAEESVKRKQSKVGLGAPQTMKLSAMRSSSNLSSSGLPQQTSRPSTIRSRMSSDSAHLVMGPNGRPASSISSGSSLRPPSSMSGISAFSLRSPRSSNGSVASVRWDEAGLQTVKEMQRRERERRRQSVESQSQAQAKSSARDRPPEGRRRATIADIFPEVRQQAAKPVPPIEPIEEVSIDISQESPSTDITSSVKKVRRRPMSEQMIGRPRPKAMSEGEDGVKSLLDAATDELACLIDRLDLEATPNESPVKRSVPSHTRSLSLGVIGRSSPAKSKVKFSFDPEKDAPLLESVAPRDSYSNAQNPAVPPTRQQAMDTVEQRKLIGKPIVPWSTLDWKVSPKAPSSSSRPGSVLRPSSHKRSKSPAPEEPSVAFEPLNPAVRRRVSRLESLPSSGTPVNIRTGGVPSSSTFGSGPNVPKIGKQPSAEFNDDDEDEEDTTPPSPSPAVRRGSSRHSRKSFVLSAMCDSGAVLPPEALKNLRLSGVLGSKEPEADDEDDDSDIPDELQNILSSHSDDELPVGPIGQHSRHNSLSPTPGVPPLAALPLMKAASTTPESHTPIFRATLMDDRDCETDIDDVMDTPREDDTYRSFDFTGELQKLISNSEPSDRRSFVEQLENAFRPSEHIDLDFSLGLGRGLFAQDNSTRSSLSPSVHKQTSVEEYDPRAVSQPRPNDAEFLDAGISGHAQSDLDQEHSFCPSSNCDTLDHLIRECEEDIRMGYPTPRHSPSPVRPKESDGKLNMSFKFGGRPSISDMSVDSLDRPLTLSDIIPPIPHFSPSRNSSIRSSNLVSPSIYAQSLEEDNSAVNAVIGTATHGFLQVPGAVQAQAQAQFPAQARPRLASDASSKRLSQDLANLSNSLTRSFGHSRNTSEASFNGFESFDEVRRGFEFHPNMNRPTFYPPPGATSRSYQNRFSMYSVASISSYGEAFNHGAVDPFGYASSRPTSSDMSMALSSHVDDTFSFMKKDNLRQRMDSDASSFHLRPTGSSHPYRRSHLCNTVNFSAMSNGPPVSIYNRMFGTNPPDDSSSSSISPAFPSHAKQGAMPAWAQQSSSDASSIQSDHSVARLGRPDVGDKMFDRDYGMTLSSISASPPESLSSERYDQQMARDSIFVEDANVPRTSSDDSIFELSHREPSYVEDNDDVFDISHSDAQQDAYAQLRQFRPLSMISLDSMSTMHTEPGEDDTMFSMLGGGRVRRRSIDSGIERSPCINRVRKKNTALQHLARTLRFEDELPPVPSDRMPSLTPDNSPHAVPERSTTNSVASTSSEDLHDEPLMMTKQGLLSLSDLHHVEFAAPGKEAQQPLQSSARSTRAGHSRSGTTSSGALTPSLLGHDDSSISSGSQGSIDIAQLNALLAKVAQNDSEAAGASTVRARPPGTGHRKRYSQIRVSRASMYETIQEESTILSSPQSFEIPTPPSRSTQPVTAASSRESIVLIRSETGELYEKYWDEEKGVMSMRSYFTLREEAHETVTESKRVWQDTAFSLDSLQSFSPPKNKTGMRALLQQSKQNYGPLPSELRPHRIRSRTSSRVSPYPIRPRLAMSLEQRHPEVPPPTATDTSGFSAALREISINPNFFNPPQPSDVDVKPFPPSTAAPELSKSEKKANTARPRVLSGSGKTALGGAKRTRKSSGKSNKENMDKENISQGAIMTNANTLRISRPRPRGTIRGRKANQAA